MPLIVKLENVEDQKWLISRLEVALDRAKNNYTIYPEYIIQIERILNSVRSATSVKITSELVPPQSSSTKPARRTKKKPASNLPGLCKIHPNYQARRVPRTECESCWAAFDKLNPLRAKSARLKFNRSQQG